VDIGKPGLMRLLSTTTYSPYNSAEFNIKTSFKWLALLAAMTSRLDNVIFMDADIKILSPLPFESFAEIWEHYDIFVQDEGNNILPKHPCTGFIGLKFCEANISLLEALHKEHCAAIVSTESQHDQSIFYNHIARNIDLYKRVYFLPQMLFPVGYLGPIYSRFKSRVSLHGQSDPVIYHANWVVGIEAKAALMDGFESPEALVDQDGSGNVSYTIGAFPIQLPAGHLLPFYQQKHLRYDRFLPHLAQALPPGSTVVDVGANCGDSLAAMASSNPSLHYICIEAHPSFFSLLQSNILSMKERQPQLQADALRELIGKDGAHAILTGSGGTMHAVEANIGDGAMQAKSLDSVLRVLPPKTSISLLKTDTDGWDHDVILSGTELIKNHVPLIFFECQYANQQQLDGFMKAIDWLIRIDYSSWFVFDNFGDFVLEATNRDTLQSLIGYIHRQNSGVSTRTIHSMDILAAQPSQRELAAAAISSFCADVATEPN
jgi:FkbM family methyltransferase